MEQNLIKPVKEWVEEIIDYFGSQKATAEAAEIRQSSVSEWVSGESKPSAKSLNKIQRKSKNKFKAREIRPELF